MEVHVSTPEVSCSFILLCLLRPDALVCFIEVHIVHKFHEGLLFLQNDSVILCFVYFSGVQFVALFSHH